MTKLAWHDLGCGHHVIELHEKVTAPGPAVELHIVRIGNDLDAWWETEDGDWVWGVEIGLA